MNTHSTEMPRAFSVEEIAERTGQSTKSVYRHIETGLLPAAKPGKRHIITISDLEKYLGEERARDLFGEEAK